MRIALTLCGAVLAAFASLSTAQAATLTGNLTSDNSFIAYLSTDDSTLGTQIASGNDWRNSVSLSQALAAGTNYFLHIVALNEGAPGSGNPDAFLGSFHLSDTLHKFANGTQDLLTGAAGWTASAVAAGVPWAAPAGGVLTFGANSDPTTIWSLNHGNAPISGIDLAAQWIWSNPDNGAAAFFSTQIVATTPIPAALPLFASALGGLGFLAHRRRRAQAQA
jgi:hypothetical protein